LKKNLNIAIFWDGGSTLFAIQPKVMIHVVCFYVWKDEQETKRRLASTDAREIQKFYEYYCQKYLEEDHEKRKP
jgi:hypothetical protein